MEKIKIENLTFTYIGKDIPAISGINLSVHSGEFITLCGKSGCGKSTLLRQLKPMLAAGGTKHGTVYIDGCDLNVIDQRTQAQTVGFVLQNPEDAIACDKVWHELAFGLENLGVPSEKIRARVAEIASFFGIQSWYHKDISELSGGQKQLLNLASVMVMQPSVLVLDEPTSQLDPIAAHDFLVTVSKINKDLGVTVILSEHRLEEVLPLSDRVAVMENGKIIASGDTGSVGHLLNESKNPMLMAFPTPMRVYYSLMDEKKAPLTVKEGREWLASVTHVNNSEFNQRVLPASGKPILTASDLWFRYRKDTADILKGINIKLRSGEIYAILGGNGAGKSTLLSVIMGINKACRGKISVSQGIKIAALPQNPKSLFVKDTLLSDLWEMYDATTSTKECMEKRIADIVSFCELEHLTDSHPYDLSGGEQQRAALAKVLLTRPDILLLDEPTKGLDTHFKYKLANLLDRLKDEGMAVIMVSHDVEFCARFSDRVAMLFDGQIVSEGSPREFFSGMSFYTTAANRMARSLLPGAILDEDIISAIGGEKPDYAYEPPVYSSEDKSDEKPDQVPIKKVKKLNIISGIIFAVIFGILQKNVNAGDYSIKSYVIQLLSIFALFFSIYSFVPGKSSIKYRVVLKKKKTTASGVISAVIVILLIPVTILFGMYYLQDKKYYFISLLIILEITAAFVVSFEGRKPAAGELVTVSILCAIAIAGRIAFVMLPQFKPVLALVIISGVCFGGETGFMVGAVTAFASNFYFIHGPWTPWQMFGFGIIGFIAGVCTSTGLLKRNKISLSIFGFIVTVVIYGGIMNPSSVLMSQVSVTWPAIRASILMGLPLDIIHGAATAFFLWFASEPMMEKIERIKKK